MILERRIKSGSLLDKSGPVCWAAADLANRSALVRIFSSLSLTLSLSPFIFCSRRKTTLIDSCTIITFYFFAIRQQMHNDTNPYIMWYRIEMEWQAKFHLKFLYFSCLDISETRRKIIYKHIFSINPCVWTESRRKLIFVQNVCTGIPRLPRLIR